MSDDRSCKEIEILKAQYARYADIVLRYGGNHDAAVAIANLFTDDGHLDLGPFGSYTGKADLLNAFQHVLPANTVWSIHYIVSPIITVDSQGNDATGDWYFLIHAVSKMPAGAPVMAIYGSYQDIYKKIDGVWKIQRSVAVYAVPPT